MADVEISYKGSQIATMSATGVKTLLTGDTFCEDDIVVSYTKPSSTLQSKTVSPTTSQQTVSPDSGYDGLSSVTVNAMPSGNVNKPTIDQSMPKEMLNTLPPMVDGVYSGNGVTAVVVDGIATLSGTTTASGNALIIPLTETAYIPTGGGAFLHCMNSVANASLAPSIELSTDISNTSIALSLSPADRIYEIPSNREGVEVDRVRFYIASGVTISGTYAPMITWDNVSTDYIPYGEFNQKWLTPKVVSTTGYITGSTKNGSAVIISPSDLVDGTKNINIFKSGTMTYDATNYKNVAVTVPSGSATVPNRSYSPSITISLDDETGEIVAHGSGSYTLAPTVTAGYVSSGTSGTISVSVWDGYQLPIYEGEHHQPPILTVSLTNPVNPNCFVSCEIYDETGGEVKIGEITSATGSVSIDLTDRFAWWDVSTLSIGVVFCFDGYLYYATSGISCTGDVSFDYGGGSGSSFFTVTGTGTIVIDGVDYDYGA